MSTVPLLLRLFGRPALTETEVVSSTTWRGASASAYDELAQRAAATGTGGLVYKNLTRYAPDAPLSAAAAAALADTYKATLADNLRRLAAADAVIGALVRRGIEVTLLKGAALVETHYEDPGLRPMGDVDLLVHPRNLEEAGAIVLALGYARRSTPGRARSEDAHYQRCFTNGREVVELHVGLCDQRRYPVDLGGLWSRARLVSWRGVPVRVLDDADHLAYVALHAALHGYILSLNCLADVSILLRRAPDAAATAALAAQRARSWRAGTAVYETLSFARAFAGAPVPDAVLEALRPAALRAAYLRLCLPGDRWPPFRFGRSLRVAQALTLLPLMDGGRAAYLAHYGQLRLADLAGAGR